MKFTELTPEAIYEGIDKTANELAIDESSRERVKAWVRIAEDRFKDICK